MNVAPEATYEAVVDWGSTGATLGMRVIDNAGATSVARVTGFSEYPAGSGVYARTGNLAPSAAGQYTLVYDDDAGVAAVGHVATEDLLVTAAAPAVGVLAGTDYVTAAQLKATLGISVAITTFDTDIAASVAAASRGIDGVCQRRFWLDANSTQVRYYTGSPLTDTLYIDDLTAVSTVKLDTGGDAAFATTLTLNTDYFLEPLNAAAETPIRPYTKLRLAQTGQTWPGRPRSVKVTGQFGWPAVPAEITRATTILATKLFKRQESPFGIVTAGVDEATAMRIASSDPDVKFLLGPYIRYSI